VAAAALGRRRPLVEVGPRGSRLCVESSHRPGAGEVLVQDGRGADQGRAPKVNGVRVGEEVVEVAHDDADQLQKTSVGDIIRMITMQGILMFILPS
jgi:hypothetical protein